MTANLSKAIALLVLMTCGGTGLSQGPGYSGSFPSAAGKAALRGLLGNEWRDETGIFGGGVWRIESGGVTPHALGPARAGVLELRTARTKGPHVLVEQGARAICLPTRTDGDVVALLQLLGRKLPDGLEGEPGPEWREAEARVRALGEVEAGLRIAVLPNKRQGAVGLLVWNVADTKSDVRGMAKLELDGVALPVSLRWPPKIEAEEGQTVLALDPGSTFETTVDLRECVKAIGKPKLLDPGPHVVEMVLQSKPADPEKKLRTVRSRKLTIETKPAKQR